MSNVTQPLIVALNQIFENHGICITHIDVNWLDVSSHSKCEYLVETMNINANVNPGSFDNMDGKMRQAE